MRGVDGTECRVSMLWFMTPPGVDQTISSTTTPLNLARLVLAQAEGLEPPKAFRPRRFSRPLPHPAGLPAYMAQWERLELSRRYSRLLPTFQAGALPIRLTTVDRQGSKIYINPKYIIKLLREPLRIFAEKLRNLWRRASDLNRNAVLRRLLSA